MQSDPTDGADRALDLSDEPATAELLIVRPRDLEVPRQSVVAGHVHDDPHFFTKNTDSGGSTGTSGGSADKS